MRNSSEFSIGERMSLHPVFTTGKLRFMSKAILYCLFLLGTKTDVRARTVSSLLQNLYFLNEITFQF